MTRQEAIEAIGKIAAEFDGGPDSVRNLLIGYCMDRRDAHGEAGEPTDRDAFHLYAMDLSQVPSFKSRLVGA